MKNNPNTFKHRFLQATYLFLLIIYLPALVFVTSSLVNSFQMDEAIVVEEVPYDGMMPKLTAPPPLCDKPKGLSEMKCYFLFTEEMPMFPACQEDKNNRSRKSCAEKEMLSFIYKNLRYPALERESSIEGLMVVNFTINEDGSLSDVKMLKSLSSGFNKEAIRLVKSMPNWIPGKQNGKVVKVKYNLPIKIRLDK